MRLKLASRKSDLARWQAVQVARAIEQASTGTSIEFSFKSSLGDQNLDLPLAGMGARGVFTEDFYADLTGGVCDLVVHSWKDLPTEERSDTRIAMTLKRADVRDVLMIPEVVWHAALKSGRLTVFTSSPRRVYNLGACLTTLLPGNLEIEFASVRGNVATRLRKMHEAGHALVLAKAGLDRLLEAEGSGFLTDDSVRQLISDCRFQIIPVSLNPPAAAQGALAVEVARSNEAVHALCAQLNDSETMKAVQLEREILKKHGGGCHQKIGVAVLRRPYGEVYALRGLTDSGQVLEEWRVDSSTAWTRATDLSKIFPQEARQNSWFERRPLPTPKALESERLLFVSRAEAWPKDYQPTQEQIIWAAGVQSWQKLAQRGIFVHGCSDGLGESEPLGLEFLLNMQTQPCKLTHSSAPGENIRATYQLEPKSKTPDLRGKTHFFWMSTTSFEQAIAAFPNEVRQGHHGCGPGRTYEYLQNVKGLLNPPKVFAGLSQFLRETQP